MEVKVEMKEKNHAEITFEGADLSLANAIRDILLQDEDVEFAGVVKEHPEVGDPKLILKVKRGNPMVHLSKAAAKLAKTAEELRKQLK